MILKDSLTFGKYKGQRVDDIIMTHIAYIYWCFENLSWFKLTDEQQQLYDMVSLAINAQKSWTLPFPNHDLLKYVRNHNIENPLIMQPNGLISVMRDKKHLHPYFKDYEIDKSTTDYADAFEGLFHCMTKEINKSIAEDYNGDADQAYDDWADAWFND